jgi:hypothetical protein
MELLKRVPEDSPEAANQFTYDILTVWLSGSAEQSEQVFSPDNPCGAHLLVSYHRHAFGLGEHYNSVHKA